MGIMISPLDLYSDASSLVSSGDWNTAIQESSWNDYKITHTPPTPLGKCITIPFNPSANACQRINLIDRFPSNTPPKRNQFILQCRSHRHEKGFWKKHRKTILITLAVVTTVAVVITVCVCLPAAAPALQAAASAAAGGAGITQQTQDKKQEPSPKSPPIGSPLIPDSSPKPIIIEPIYLPLTPTDQHPRPANCNRLPFTPQMPFSPFPSVTLLDDGFIENGQYTPYSPLNPTGSFQPFKPMPINLTAPPLNATPPLSHTPPRILPPVSYNPFNLIGEQLNRSEVAIDDLLLQDRTPYPFSHNPLNLIGEQLNRSEVSLNDPLLQNRAPETFVFSIEGIEYYAKRIGFINGMDTSFQEATKHAQYISDLSGSAAIEYVHNKTHGKALDLAEIFLLNYEGHSIHTANQLVENWTRFAEEYKDDPDAIYLQIGHSQGMIHIDNALNQAPPEIARRVDVLGIAGAKAIPSEICHHAINYESTKDIVPLAGRIVDLIQCQLRALLKTGTLVILYNPENDQKALGQTTILNPHPNTPDNLDHGFRNPTYKERLEDQLKNYLKEDS